MDRVGARELRQNLSKFLDRVKQGESSALVKLAVPEPESAALREAFRELDSMTSSELTVAEVGRAATLDPPKLRSLDAIHVATALELETADLVFFAYDRRTLEAASANGLTVASPGV